MFSIPTDPAMILTTIGVVATAILLTMAVITTLQNPVRRQSFQAALDIYQTGSELDIDTALNKSETKSKGWYEKWYDKATSSGAVPKTEQAPGNTAIGCLVGGAAFGFLVAPGGLFGAVVVGVLGVFAYNTYLMGQARKRITTMEKQLPQLLSGLRANLSAGATPQQALMSVADDIPAPLGDELKILKRDLNVNVPMQDALHGLADRVPSREMQFLVASIEIAIRSGADLDPQLATIQEIVAQRTRIRQKLTSAVAQVKPTKLLAMGAVPLMFIVSMREPGNAAYWFGEGIFVLIIAGTLYGAGVYVIRLMVRSVENT